MQEKKNKNLLTENSKSNELIYNKTSRVLNKLFNKKSLKKILFVLPPDFDEEFFSYDVGKRGRYTNFPPYGLGLLSSHLLKNGYEVNILNFLEKASKKNFKIVLPVIKSSNIMNFKSWIFKEPLYVNKFGMLEPKNSNKNTIPDLIMVPLVAFDNHLNRIGYGKGYYDRSLRKINKIKKNAISLGIAYSFQKCQKIPTNKQDFKLDYVFTEKGIINSK